jgi:putative membrane protein insertion efficiency factor
VAEQQIAGPRGIARVFAAVVRFYQLAISPLLGPRCRFAPSCSEYALEALAVHGALRGSWMAVRRLSRCHPFHEGGYDPVPIPKERRDSEMSHAAAPPSHPASHPASSSKEAGECLC